ncbi:MAG: hypothetical protein AAF558_07160 [Verrucomicrobiota bacterium]
MHFLDIPERVNQLLYRKDVHRLTKRDMASAKQWSLRLIRDSHPEWTEQQVLDDYERLSHIKVVAIDQWSKRNGVPPSV